MQSVLEVVEAQFERWAGTGAGSIDRDVLGTDEPSRIADIFEHFCIEQFACSPAGGLFYAASTGCVLGVHLEDGTDVVLKAYQSRWTESFLAAVQDGESCAADGGIPCPRPLVAPAPIRAGRPNLAVAETWLPDPGMRPGGSAAARGVSARGLSRVVALCAHLPASDRLLRHPLNARGFQLYPEPHSPLFDFETTAAGAEWIDELARQASALRGEDESTAVVAHTDWSARNVRFDENELLAVYDWDSLALVAESAALGQAAMTWSVTADPRRDGVPDVGLRTGLHGGLCGGKEAANWTTHCSSTSGGASIRRLGARLHRTLRTRVGRQGAGSRGSVGGSGAFGRHRCGVISPISLSNPSHGNRSVHSQQNVTSVHSSRRRSNGGGRGLRSQRTWSWPGGFR